MTPYIDTQSYIQYLAAKRQIDDRALSRHVWDALCASLPEISRRRPLEVVEMGGGIGTMFERVIDWSLASDLHYVLVEVNRAYLDECEARISIMPHTVNSSEGKYWGQTDSGIAFSLETVCTDIYDVISDPGMNKKWDLIIAHAVMDILNLEETLGGFRRLLRSGGLVYLSLNYDGITCFLPPYDPAFETTLFFRYHRSMDKRIIDGRPSGSSQSGRQLISYLNAMNVNVLEIGNSDWFVYPRNGSYSQDEICFLDMIIHTIQQQLHKDNQIDQRKLEQWTVRRKDQAEAGELIFMARNLDILGVIV